MENVRTTGSCVVKQLGHTKFMQKVITKGQTSLSKPCLSTHDLLLPPGIKGLLSYRVTEVRC